MKACGFRSKILNTLKLLYNSIVIIEPTWLNRVFCPSQLEEISSLTHMVSPPASRDDILANPERLRNVDVILGGWLLPKFEVELLDAAPNLKAVFYSGGTVKGFVTDEFIDRGIVLTNAQDQNGVPVAEFCLGAILLSTKQTWRNARLINSSGKWQHSGKIIGNYRSTIGIVSLGTIGRKTVDLLKHFDFRIKVQCPFLSEQEALEIGVEKATLEQIFKTSDVISLHTPDLPETHGMIKGSHFRSMKPSATFINTARGAVVNQPEMVAALKERSDINAILDVLNPEPPLVNEELLTLPNTFITPHIAGSQGNECQRLGQTAIDELRRFTKGEKLANLVLLNELHRTA